MKNWGTPLLCVGPLCGQWQCHHWQKNRIVFLISLAKIPLPPPPPLPGNWTKQQKGGGVAVALVVGAGLLLRLR